MATTYTTSQGNMWDSISYACYGTEKHMHLLLDANQEHRDTVVFSAGVVLSVPDAPEAASEVLPPWK